MAIEAKAAGGKSIKSPEYAKSEERQFGEAMEHMIDLIGRIYKNQVIKELNQSTVNKFADCFPDDVAIISVRSYLDADNQVGNFAVVFNRISKRIEKKLLKRFDDDRINTLANDVLTKTNKANQKKLYKRIEKAIGVNTTQLIANENLKPTTNAFILETSQWAKKLRDDTLEHFSSSVLRNMALGNSIDTILSEYDDLVEKRKNHAKMVARTQIATFNSLVTKVRAQNLGITEAIWITADDERVRGKPGGKYPKAKPNHNWANKKKFNLSEGLKFPSGHTLLPGVDYQCRCTYELIIPEE